MEPENDAFQKNLPFMFFSGSMLNFRPGCDSFLVFNGACFGSVLSVWVEDVVRRVFHSPIDDGVDDKKAKPGWSHLAKT